MSVCVCVCFVLSVYVCVCVLSVYVCVCVCVLCFVLSVYVCVCVKGFVCRKVSTERMCFVHCPWPLTTQAFSEEGMLQQRTFKNY